jgi:hypothetical protein
MFEHIQMLEIGAWKRSIKKDLRYATKIFVMG